MSNRRMILFLLAAILAAGSADFLVARRGSRTRFSEADDAFLPVARERIVRLAIRSAGKGGTVLVREGDGWSFASPFPGSADARIVDRLLDRLADVRPIDVMSERDLRRSPVPRGRLGLESPSVVIDLAGSDGSSGTIAFGGGTPNGTGLYAERSSSKAVFILPDGIGAAVDLRADDFRDHRLFGIPQEAVTAVDLRRADGFSATVDAARVGRLLGDLLSASSVDFVWPTGASNETRIASASLLAGYGLGADSDASITLHTVDGADARVAFGREAGDGLVYALVRNGEAVVTVDAALRESVRAQSSLFADTRLFPFEEKSVSAFSITEAGVVYTVVSGGKGIWRMESPVVAPADQDAVRSLLSRLLALRSPDRDEKGVLVALSTNQPPIAVSRQAALGRMRLTALRSPEIVRIDKLQVKRLVVTPSNASEATAVVHDEESGMWCVETSAAEGGVSEQAIDALLSSLDPLLAVRVECVKANDADIERYGLAAPSIVLSIDSRREDVMRRSLLVGTRTEGGYFAMLGSADAVFVISEETVKALSAALVAH